MSNEDIQFPLAFEIRTDGSLKIFDRNNPDSFFMELTADEAYKMMTAYMGSYPFERHNVSQSDCG